MVWLVIVLGALFVIAPVFWIMPTPAQRRQERMRARARALGLEVFSVELPQTRRHRVRGEDRRRGMLYRAPLPPEAELEPMHLRWVREQGETKWELDESFSERERVTLAPPADLPPSASGYEIARAGVGLYWRESDEAAVDVVAALLHRERDQLLAGHG